MKTNILQIKEGLKEAIEREDMTSIKYWSNKLEEEYEKISPSIIEIKNLPIDKIEEFKRLWNEEISKIKEFKKIPLLFEQSYL